MNFGPPRAQLCVDNSVLESVQVLTINSQIKASTKLFQLRALNHKVTFLGDNIDALGRFENK